MTLKEQALKFCNELDIPAIIRDDKPATKHYGKECIAVGLPLFYDPTKARQLDDKLESLNLNWYQCQVVDLMGFPEDITTARII